MKLLAIRVSGKVQGVFFRASAKDQADRIGVKGFVRNEPSGGVYIEAEGEGDQLKLFLDWCAQGPSRARVEKILTEELPLKNFDAFVVSR